MHTQLVAAAVLLLLLPQLAVTTAAASIVLPGCQSMCGGVDIPYPFGTGKPRCYRRGFEVTCQRQSGGAPRLLLGTKEGPQVLEISVKDSTVAIRSPVRSFNAGNTTKVTIYVLESGKPYVLSAARNLLVHTGCGYRAESWSHSRRGSSTGSACSLSPCPAAPPPLSGECSGDSCCYALMPRASRGNFTRITTKLHWNHTSTTRNATLVVVESKWGFEEENVKKLKENLQLHGNTATGTDIRAILDWSIGKSSSCNKARQSPDYACSNANSECRASTSNAKGYVCRCRKGYQGNPYIPDGCQSTTTPSHRNSHGTYIAMGFGIGMCLLLVVLATIYAIKTLKDRKTKKMREYFFKQNRGLLLEQLVDKDITERMIFSVEELDKATNKFDEARILGGGGHGTVYKGILSNQHVVAIKKSKLVIQREIDGFINEVAILSQINHRNVVRLFGCCLETEVPLLVYEFISNGTLYAHLHVVTPVSLPWNDRLRIASEVASSLAYLHSQASISIVHRDIKTSNILLDDRLTAKVSDFGASRGISIDKSGVTTAIQGTYGYLDPEYFYTRRLTEKSDVYSFGVMLVELLTRMKPTIDISDGVSLVAHFIQLFSEDRLSEILDVQVIGEGEEEAKQVAAVAALCLQIKGDDRPTMRQVEKVLQGIQSSDDYFQGNPGVQGMGVSNNTTIGGSNVVVHDNNSRRFSMEREMLLSASLPR